MGDIEAIYLEYFNSVYRFALSLSQNQTVAEEVAQETFFKAMEHLDRFDGKGSISAWLYQIARNTYYTMYRKQKRLTPESEFEPLPASQDLEGRYLDQETSRRLHLLLHRLKEPYKEVFTLRVFGELPFAQIGELFGKTDSWARLVFYRAKNELRRQLDETAL